MFFKKGGSGFIGQTLKEHLSRKGHNITIISRTAGPNRVLWNEIERHGTFNLIFYFFYFYISLLIFYQINSLISLYYLLIFNHEGIPEVDAVIQIPGANILARPWTEARKKEV